MRLMSVIRGENCRPRSTHNSTECHRMKPEHVQQNAVHTASLLVAEWGL